MDSNLVLKHGREVLVTIEFRVKFCPIIQALKIRNLSQSFLLTLPYVPNAYWIKHFNSVVNATFILRVPNHSSFLVWLSVFLVAILYTHTFSNYYYYHYYYILCVMYVWVCLPQHVCGDQRTNY